MKPDYYRVLQVDPQADPDVVEAAYKRLARKIHPDVSAAPDAGARMRELNEAYAVVGDASRRAGYDAKRRRGRAERPMVTPAARTRRRAPRVVAHAPAARPIPRPGRAALAGFASVGLAATLLGALGVAQLFRPVSLAPPEQVASQTLVVFTRSRTPAPTPVNLAPSLAP